MYYIEIVIFIRTRARKINTVQLWSGTKVAKEAKMKLTHKLTLVFLIIGILPAFVIGLFSFNLASTGLTEQAFNQLKAVREIKKTQIESFFAERRGDMEMLVETIATLQDSFDDISTVQSLLSKPRVGETESFFRKYIESYGYYDLFLINNQGDVFFTEAKEADYGTSLINGPYSDSGLAMIFKRAKETRGFVLQDFSPYAPSNNEPASFIAQPIYNKGKLVVIIALQLSIDKINRFMQVREGMGKTGESYLVGSDKRMRSDSFLDPEGHSVKASFTGSIENNGVNTLASKEALRGNTGTKIIIDYNGNPVLSAYTSVNVEGNTWALISEIDEAEAFAIITELKIDIAIVIGLVMVAVVVLGVVVARSITTPLGGEPNEMKSIAEEIADGNLTLDFEDNRGEQGSVYVAMHKMTLTLHEMITKIVAAGGEIAKTSEETSVVTQQTNDIVQQQQRESGQVATASTEMTVSVQEVANNASRASTAAETASREAQLAQEVTSRTNEAIVNLAEEISQATAKIFVLEEQSNQIGSVLDVIRGIADQTNLLALNAAIEAARAGDYGRGFAVVADEVRSLAYKTQESTTDIESMISQLQTGSREAVKMMESSTHRTEETIKMGNRVVVAITGISNAVDAINDMNAQIASAAEEQSTVSEDINQRIINISDLSQQTAGGAQQTAEATLQMAVLAEKLNELVEKFKVA